MLCHAIIFLAKFLLVVGGEKFFLSTNKICVGLGV